MADRSLARLPPDAARCGPICQSSIASGTAASRVPLRSGFHRLCPGPVISSGVMTISFANAVMNAPHPSSNVEIFPKQMGCCFYAVTERDIKSVSSGSLYIGCEGNGPKAVF